MPKHNEIGIKGEEIAAEFLKNKGLLIIATNWRFGNKEIDIIAGDRDLLLFIEVKTRKNTRLSFPEEAVGGKKRQLLQTAATHFFESQDSYRSYRFDIISIVYFNGVISEIVHFENAF